METPRRSSGKAAAVRRATARSDGLLLRTLGRLLRDPGAVFGLAVFLGMVVLAVSAPIVAPYDPLEIDATSRLAAPSVAHLFGTDELGRDVLSRIIFGARITLTVSALAAGAALLGALPLGLMAGYRGGWIDAAVSRLFDTIFAFPGILLGIGLVAGLGAGVANVALAVAIINIPTFGRLTRVGMLTQRVQDYVEAARAIGALERRVILRHILPNLVPPLLVQMTITMANAALLEAAFSFLGLGSRPPTPSWGVMLDTGRNYLAVAPWLGFFAGFAITIMVLALNMLGDGLRKALDPRAA